MKVPLKTHSSEIQAISPSTGSHDVFPLITHYGTSTKQKQMLDYAAEIIPCLGKSNYRDISKRGDYMRTLWV